MRVKDREWQKVKFRLHFLEYDAPDGKKYTILGLTASFLIHAASIILIFRRKPDFLEFCPT